MCAGEGNDVQSNDRRKSLGFSAQITSAETQKQPNQPIDDGNRWGGLSQSQGLSRETVTISALGKARSTVCDQGNHTGHDA